MALEIFEKNKFKVIIFTSMEKKGNLLPLEAKRSSSLLFVSGKTILEWIISSCQKHGFNDFIFIISKENKEEIQSFLINKKNSNLEKNATFDFIEFSSKKGFTRENRTVLIESLLTNYSLWIDSEIIFSEKFMEDFVLNIKVHEKFALVKEEKQTQEFWGIGYFTKNDLETNLLGAKSLSDIYERVSQKTTNQFPIMVYDEKKMEYWKIRYLWNLLDANQVLINYIEERNEGIIEEGVSIKGKVCIEEGARIRSGSYIEGPVFIGKECDIGPNCYLRNGVALQQKVRIGNACEIKNTLIYDGSHIAHLSYVGDSIIGEKCNFGAGTITGNLRLDDKIIKAQAFNDEVVSSGRRKLGVIMGDNVKTAINTHFMPGVIIGNNSAIGTGVIVNRNIPDNTFVFLEQQLVTQEWKKKPK